MEYKHLSLFMQHATRKGQKGVRCPRVIIIHGKASNLVRLRACHVSIFKIGQRRTISSSWTNLQTVVFQVSRKHLAIISTTIIHSSRLQWNFYSFLDPSPSVRWLIIQLDLWPWFNHRAQFGFFRFTAAHFWAFWSLVAQWPVFHFNIPLQTACRYNWFVVDYIIQALWKRITIAVRLPNTKSSHHGFWLVSLNCTGLEQVVRLGYLFS